MFKYLLEVCEGVTLRSALILIAAIIFLYLSYKKFKNYMDEKAIREHEKGEQIQAVIDQSKNYPEWHKHSLKVQDRFTEMISDIDRKVDDLAKASEEGMAYTWRYRILRFDDEIRHDKRHTKEHFDQILEDIQNYKNYCRDHPEFPNNKAQFAIMNIESIYKKCVEEGTFL